MDKTQSIKDFLCQIPKAELHLHIEGTLEPELMIALSKRNNQKIPYNSIEEAQNIYQLALNSFNASFITAEEKQKFITELDHFMKINEHTELVLD